MQPARVARRMGVNAPQHDGDGKANFSRHPHRRFVGVVGDDTGNAGRLPPRRGRRWPGFAQHSLPYGLSDVSLAFSAPRAIPHHMGPTSSRDDRELATWRATAITLLLIGDISGW